MEYSLQIDLAICLNTEYVWTKRTKIVIRYLYLMTFLLCCESVREYSLFRGSPQSQRLCGERRNIRSVCYDFALQNCLNTECVSTKSLPAYQNSEVDIYLLRYFYYVRKYARTP